MTVRSLILAFGRAAAICAAPGLLLANAAHADDDPVPACELCPTGSGWELDLSGGFAGVSGDDLFHFGDYTGLDDSGLYFAGNLFARYLGEDARFFRVEGYRLGLDSQAIFAEGGKQGHYAYRVSYQGIPRRFYDTTATPFRPSGDDELNLVSGWVRSPTTQGMTALGTSLEPVDIKRDWAILQLGMAYEISSQWAFDVNYRQQKRDGQSMSSGTYFFDAAMFASPVVDTTDELEAIVNYSAETWHLSASYWGAFFDNGVSSLTFDNPFSAVSPGADSGRLARAPDNDSHQLRVAGSMILPARTTLVGHASIGRMEQDESFLPYTINSQIATGLLPSPSADAEVETTSVGLRVTSSPMRKLTVEGDFRYNDRDNRTAEREFNYVVTDLFNAADSATNIAYDYERSEFRLRGEYRVLSRTKVQAGYDVEEFRRSGQERGTTDTGRLWLQLRTRAIPHLDVDVEFYAEDRDGSVYTPIENVAAPQNPLMRKYNMADRERDGVKGTVSAYVTERINVGFNAEVNEDDYTDSLVGLQGSEYSRYGLEGSYAAASGMSVYGAVYQEDVESTMANSQGFATPDWTSTTDDSFFTGNLGVTFPDIIDRLDFNAQFAITESEGDTANSTNGLASRFPTFESSLQQFQLGLDYQYSDALSLQFKYFYENADTDDWHLDGVQPATVPNLLSLGASPWDYTAHVVFVGVRYVLDTRGQGGIRLPK